MKSLVSIWATGYQDHNNRVLLAIDSSGGVDAILDQRGFNSPRWVRPSNDSAEGTEGEKQVTNMVAYLGRLRSR